MDLETWFQIHTNVSNFEMASLKTIQVLKVAHCCYHCKIMLCSYHFDKTELRIIMIFINFQVYHRNEKNFESSYGFGGTPSQN